MNKPEMTKKEEFIKKFCTQQQMQYLATQIITLDNFVVKRNTDANDVWSWIENEIRQTRIKQLEDAKAYTESKLGCGYNSFTEKVLIEMARQYQHLISELEKEKI